MLKYGGILLFYMFVIEPFLEARSFDGFKALLKKSGDPASKLKLYREGFARNLLMVVAAIIIFYFSSGTKWSLLGFKGFSTAAVSSLPLPVFVIMLIIIAAYVLYFYLPIYLPLTGKKGKQYIYEKVEHAYDHLPFTTVEKAWWIFNSFFASAEEVVYRGFLFLLIGLMVPCLPIWGIVIVAAVIEAVRYMHRPVVVIYIFISGLTFGSLYVIFGTIWAPIIAHVLNDLRPFAMPLKGLRAYVQNKRQEAEKGE